MNFWGRSIFNKSLHKLGYYDVQIIHRLEVSLTEEQNRHTNPIKFIDKAELQFMSKLALKVSWNMHAVIQN